MITTERYNELNEKSGRFAAWLGDRRSYRPEEVPAHCPAPTNEERSQMEVFQFVNMPPEKYFCYIRRVDCDGNPAAASMRFQATTFTGEILGEGILGHGYETPAFYRPSRRYPVRFKAINGREYAGTYYASSGDYARIKAVKQ